MTTLPKLSKILDELEWLGGIPEQYQMIIEERVIILCTKIGRQPPQSNPRTSKAYQLQHQQKKAREVYRSVLHQCPHIFLPVLIAVSPRNTRRFRLRDFQGQKKEQKGTHLSLQSRWTLKSLAIREGFADSPDFSSVIEKLFPSRWYHQLNVRIVS